MSFSSSDDDSQQRFALGFLFALIALVVAGVVGTVVVKRGLGGAKAPAVAAAPAAAVADDGASVRVENGVVKFYFATGKADLAAGANEALADIVKGVAAGQKAVVSGFHDATGDAAQNAELDRARELERLHRLASREHRRGAPRDQRMGGAGHAAAAEVRLLERA